MVALGTPVVPEVKASRQVSSAAVSTASRWVSAAVKEVGDETRRRLRERLGLSADSAESVARMVGSQLELSLSRLLGSAPELQKPAS